MSEAMKIDCEEALKRMFEYIDHELHAVRHEEMEKHLAACRSCYSRLEFEQHLRRHIKGAAGGKAPEQLQTKIKDLIRKL